MTNYEKMKSLSFDEMYKLLDDNLELNCDVCPYSDGCSVFINSDKCGKALKDWLKAESEED